MRRRQRDVRTDPIAQARISRAMLSRVQRARRDARLSGTDLNLYGALVERTVLGYGDGRLGCKRLAELVRRTPRTVRRRLAYLEALGYVVVEERQEKHGGPAVNYYRPVTPKDWSARETDRRRAARLERDRARKRRGGVLTRSAPALTRGRVNAPSGTGRGTRKRPPVPVGQANEQEAAPMPLTWWSMDGPAKDGQGTPRWAPPPQAAQSAWGGLPATPRRTYDPATDAEDVAAARAKIAALVARGSAARGWAK